MCSRHQPEEGADSQPVDPPMVELPRADRAMVMEYTRAAMPGATEQEVLSEVARVEMADALGRAIHASRGVGEVINIQQCVRVRSDGAPEPVPYGYEDKERGFACDCEDIALHLVEQMKAQAAMHDVKSHHLIVAPSAGNGRIN